MSKAAELLVYSIREDVLTMISVEMTVREFSDKLEDRIAQFEKETYEYTKQAITDSIKSASLEP